MTAEQRETIQALEMQTTTHIWYDDVDGHWMARRRNVVVDLLTSCPMSDGNAIDEAAAVFGLSAAEAEAIVVSVPV